MNPVLEATRSNAEDTDFTVKLIDVYPPNANYSAGVNLNLADGIVRPRYRESPKTATLPTGSEPREYPIEMDPTSLPARCLYRNPHEWPETSIRIDLET